MRRNVSLNDSVIIKIKLEAPFFNSNKMCVYIDDSKENFIRKYSDNNEVIHTIIPSDTDTFMFSGFVEEFRYNEDSKTNVKRTFFDENYRIRQPPLAHV